jgi:succinate dehydrogenase assembly factor 1
MEFSKNMGIDKRDFDAIEALIRKGRRQLEIFKDPQVKRVS